MNCCSCREGPNAPSYEQIGDDSDQYRGSTADFKGALQQHPPRNEKQILRETV